MELQDSCIECGRLWIDLGRAIESALKTSARFAAAATASNFESISVLASQMHDANSRQQAAQRAFEEHRATHARTAGANVFLEG